MKPFTSELSTRLDRDKLMMMSRDRAAELGHIILEPLTNSPAAENLAAVAIAFAVLSNRYSMGPEELYHYGMKILTEPTPHHRKGNALLDSLQDWAGMRVRNEAII
ncbi:hypothetical protein [Agrobacterium sp. CFBP2214]|uniref:hypothetical protein n=1 Tax=Agrobacterium sp. CFBP2214 TaxID=3040274 RepID=UPI000DCFEE1F|nr:hypothetical protein [Agrobacterium sp. CFBP2214]